MNTADAVLPEPSLPAGCRCTVRRGLLSAFGADAIICAAPPDLGISGGVRAALYHAAGPGPFEECRFLVETRGALPAGTACLSAAGRLQARHLIHAVIPDWHHGSADARRRFAAALRVALALARKHSVRSIALPALGCDEPGWPAADAAAAAVAAVRTCLRLQPAAFDSITWVCDDDETFAAFSQLLAAAPQ
ncbi:MAG TPA: macro domain-containing protein [bacterium]|nr:macro domain-containing protein [bacterium]